MLSVENIFGADHDVWNVNVEAEYHEEKSKNAEGEAAATADAGASKVGDSDREAPTT